MIILAISLVSYLRLSIKSVDKRPTTTTATRKVFDKFPTPPNYHFSCAIFWWDQRPTTTTYKWAFHWRSHYYHTAAAGEFSDIFFFAKPPLTVAESPDLSNPKVSASTGQSCSQPSCWFFHHRRRSQPCVEVCRVHRSWIWICFGVSSEFGDSLFLVPFWSLLYKDFLVRFCCNLLLAP